MSNIKIYKFKETCNCNNRVMKVIIFVWNKIFQKVVPCICSYDKITNSKHSKETKSYFNINPADLFQKYIEIT